MRREPTAINPRRFRFRTRYYTTAEVIEDEKFLRHSKRKPPRNKIVQITVGYGSSRIGKIVREAGGKWNRKAKVWELPYEMPWSWDWRKVW